MKKISFLLVLISAIVLTQGCKKDNNTTATPTVKPIFQAYIGSPVWTPDTVSATLNYNTITKKKTFTVTGQKSQKKIEIVFTDPNSADNNSISTGTYKVDNTSYLQLSYFTQIKDATGNYVFDLVGNAAPNSGTFYIDGIDTDKKIITGTFNFRVTKNNYDSNGNIVSISNVSVTTGTMQDLPYTFVRQ